MMKERTSKCIFKVNHIFRISVLLLHVSALQERHLQGAQRILIKLCECYIISAKLENVGNGYCLCCQPKEPSAKKKNDTVRIACVIYTYSIIKQGIILFLGGDQLI
jgi:hypothetical protein